MKTKCTLFAVLLTLATFAKADEIYSANAGRQTVSHSTSKGNKEVAEIALGGLPLYLASTGDGAWVYASQREANGVAVINTATDTHVAGMGIGAEPRKLVIGNGDTRLYVAIQAQDPTCGSPTTPCFVIPQVAVVDITKNPDGTRANVFLGAVNVRDAVGFSVVAFSVATCTIPATPTTPAQHFMAVGTASGDIVQYDASVFPPSALASRSIGAGVFELRYSADCAKLYAGLVNESTGVSVNLHVLNRATLATSAALQLGLPDFDLPLYSTLVGTYLYLTASDGMLYVVDTASDTLVSSMAIATSIKGIAAGDRLYVAVDFTIRNGQVLEQNLIQVVRLGATPDKDALDGTIQLGTLARPEGITVLQSATKGGGRNK